MNFGVIGEPCIDYIHREGREEEKKLGGILYAVTGLAVISGNEHEIYPVMNLGEDEYDRIISFLSNFKNIKTDFIFRVKGKVRVVKLFYKHHTVDYQCPESRNKKTYDREESSTQPIEPVGYNNIKHIFGKIDSLLINMVSGKDISLETLKMTRKEFEGYIHFDAHNIVMKTHPDGQRIQGPIENWDEWLMNSDSFQMNETEASVISPELLNEYEIANKILSIDGNNPKAMVITRGMEGVTLFEKKEKKEYGKRYIDLDRTDLPAIENTKFKDSTGCGDIFGAGFFYKNSISGNKDYTTSMNYANKLASAKTEFIGVEEMKNIKLKNQELLKDW